MSLPPDFPSFSQLSPLPPSFFDDDDDDDNNDNKDMNSNNDNAITIADNPLNRDIRLSPSLLSFSNLAELEPDDSLLQTPVPSPAELDHGENDIFKDGTTDTFDGDDLDADKFEKEWMTFEAGQQQRDQYVLPNLPSTPEADSDIEAKKEEILPTSPLSPDLLPVSLSEMPSPQPSTSGSLASLAKPKRQRKTNKSKALPQKHQQQQQQQPQDPLQLVLPFPVLEPVDPTAGKSLDANISLGMLNQLLSMRDQKTEAFLKSVLDELQPGNEQLSADELRDRWFREASTKLCQVSLTLSHKMSSLLQHALQQKLDSCLNDTYTTVETTPIPAGDMAKRYRACFDAWVNATDCISIEAGNPRLLGRLHPTHYFILTLFAFATNRRIRGDDILMLCITGESSVGKSTLFENCLIEGSHLQCSEDGVGRFNTGSKNILFYHDVPITRLWIGKDAEKVRTISRGETTVAKVHSSTQMIAPLFLLATSNMRLMEHKFAHAILPSGYQVYPSQAVPTGNRRLLNMEMLKAIQMRFLEVYCRKAPPLDTALLPKNGCFLRSHMIVGLYTRVLDVLRAYSRQDFYSIILANYVVSGLCKNFAISARLLNLGADTRAILERQVAKFSEPKQTEALLGMLP